MHHQLPDFADLPLAQAVVAAFRAAFGQAPTLLVRAPGRVNLMGVFGARMVGGGFGSCTINLVAPE